MVLFSCLEDQNTLENYNGIWWTDIFFPNL